MDRALGRTLRTAGRACRIHELVASGSFGGVYFGRDLGTNQAVAVKLLHPHHADNPRVVPLFEREAALRGGPPPSRLPTLPTG